MRDAAQACSGAHVTTGRVDLDLDAAHKTLDTQSSHGRVDLDPGQGGNGAHDCRAGVDLRAAHMKLDTQKVYGGAPSCGGHTGPDAQNSLAAAPSCSDQCSRDDQYAAVAAPHDALLLILADAVEDLERVRIATDNRIRSLAQVKGLDDSPETARLASIRDGIAALEHSATLDLQRAMRAHPLGPWVRRTVGVGEKQAARLLASIGDPAARPNPAKLWQYCGHGDPARSHCRKGRPVEHSPMAKMRTRLIANSCIKQAHSPYRAVYDRERAKWADRDTTDMHKHNHALRVVGKAMLLDLWREARDLRGDQELTATQQEGVPADLPPTTVDASSNVAPSAAELEVAA